MITPGSIVRPKSRRCLLALLLAVASVACRPKDYGSLTPGPRGIVETPVADYPFGDAVDVYRAALDLLYRSGPSRPSMIVIRDSAILRYGGPCAKCPPFGPHKSRIDTSSIEGFASIPPVKPRIRKFSYALPIALLTNTELAEMWTAGHVYDSIHAHDHSPHPGEPSNGYDREFLRHYPGAWGSVDFSLVGFNTTHSEALLEIHESCGAACYSLETVFFRKVSGVWQPIERIPRQVSYEHNLFPYLGPAGDTATRSQLLVDPLGAPLRSYARDESSVYGAVLDSLYDFHGERPRKILIAGRHVRPPYGVPSETPPIDSSTRAAFSFEGAIPDPMTANLNDRIPIVILNADSLLSLDVEGVPLQREAELKPSNEETAGFWLALRRRYPGAWGYVEFSRIGYNPEHTQAVVYAAHNCGNVCGSGDVWLLTRAGEKWSVAARNEISELASPGWSLDSLKYLGKAADPTWYHSRRARGIATSFETGATLPSLGVTFYSSSGFRATVKTDSAGGFQLDNLPMAMSLFFKVACPVPGRADTVAGEFLSMTRPGLDTTVNLAVPFRGCKHLNRRNPLIAGTNPIVAQSPDSSYSSSDLVGVYRGILDALYPPGTRAPRGILIEPSPVRQCYFCVESEAPRLIRQGVLDSSTEHDFAVSPDTVAPRPFDYRIRIDTLALWDRYWLAEGGKVEWDAMKDAYPGVTAAISFLRVGFNDRHTQALAEFYVDTVGAEDRTETMLLDKRAGGWRVALRNVERDTTSAEWVGGKCEPTDAPRRLPSSAEVEKLAGDYQVVRVGASRAFRGQTDTLQIRLGAFRATERQSGELVGSAELLEANGKPSGRVAVTFKKVGPVASFGLGQRLPPGVAQLDGWHESHRILRITSDSFFGTWDTVAGPTIPRRGYFCASRIDARVR
jgi:hypothetical protein